MIYLGDYAPGAVIRGAFNTKDPGQAPITLDGSPVLSAYKDADDTQTVTGVTLEVDADNLTGLHRFAVDTADAFYAAGATVFVVITTGTVDSISVVGQVIGFFTLNKVSGLRPTTAGRTLDVSAAGNAGIDWANVENPATVLDLSGTLIKDVTDLTTFLTALALRIPASLVGGRMDSSLGAINGVVAAAQNLALSAQGIISGTASSGTLTTTQMTSSGLAAAIPVADKLNGRRIVWISGTAVGQHALISDWDPAGGGLLTFSAVAVAPVAGDIFVIV